MAKFSQILNLERVREIQSKQKKVREKNDEGLRERMGNFSFPNRRKTVRSFLHGFSSASEEIAPHPRMKQKPFILN